MPGWLQGLLNLFGGTLRQLWNDIISVIQTVYNWLWQAVQSVYHDVLAAWNYTVAVAGYIDSFIRNTYDLFVRWVDNAFNDVYNWTYGLVKSVEHDIGNVLSWADNAINTVEKWVQGLWSDLEKWVISSVWDPLYHGLTGAISWIEREGTYAYDLLTHPDKLALLLISYLWSAWLTLFRAYSKPIVGFVLQNWRQYTPDLVAVMEDIISSFF